jgi:hypothetical protein
MMIVTWQKSIFCDQLLKYLLKIHDLEGIGGRNGEHARLGNVDPCIGFAHG